MENERPDLLATLRFQEDLLCLTQGLQSGADTRAETGNPVSELVKIARKASFRA